MNRSMDLPAQPKLGSGIGYTAQATPELRYFRHQMPSGYSRVSLQQKYIVTTNNQPYTVKEEWRDIPTIDEG